MTDLDALTAFAVAELDETLGKWLARILERPPLEVASKDGLSPLVEWLSHSALPSVSAARRVAVLRLTDSMTVREISDALGVSYQRIHQILND